MRKNEAQGRPLSHAEGLGHIKPCLYSSLELTDDELFQDSPPVKDAKILTFKTSRLNLSGEPCTK